jgi:ABC-type multidrug transport system ATPase subunit
MGSSGAGKTSLLNIISDRIKSNYNNKITGEVLVNENIKLNNTVFGKVGAYVM